MMPCEDHRQDSWARQRGWVGYLWYFIDYSSKQEIEAGMFVLNAGEVGEELLVVVGVQEPLASCTHSFSSLEPLKPLLLV